MLRWKAAQSPIYYTYNAGTHMTFEYRLHCLDVEYFILVFFTKTSRKYNGCTPDQTWRSRLKPLNRFIANICHF